MQSSSQSPDLNMTDILWQDLRKAVNAYKYPAIGFLLFTEFSTVVELELFPNCHRARGRVDPSTCGQSITNT